MKETKNLSLNSIFWVFLIAGLTFGGGLAIVSVLQEELIQKRKVISKEKFLTYYSLSRLVPTGTQTALAISLGNYLAGLKGAVAAASGLLAPVFVSTVLLTIIFLYFQTGPAVEILPKAVLPAALAIIFIAAYELAKPSFRKPLELVVAVGAFVVAAFLKVPPALVLLTGGVLGIFIFRNSNNKEE